MDNDHGITDELREWAKKLTHWWYDPVKNEYTYTSGAMPPSIDAIRLDSNILAIADRIDAEHEAACAEAYGNGVMSVPIALDESQWVKLPVSEDGDVLHIGDKVDEMLPFGGYAAPAPIDTMELSRGASGYRWMVKLDAENRALISPKLLRHHHEPTVEDVLRDYASRILMAGCIDEEDELVDEYAAKLRLAGDAE